jgi:CheY-like chemotaxis protein
MAARFEARLKTRILAFGSSNTERFLPGMHWFDVFDLALQNRIGRIHQCLNTGIGGHTTRDLLARFEEDTAFFKPHLVFITVGGNDSNPDRKITPDEFEANLVELHRRISSWGCAVVFQTYYAVNPAQVGEERALAGTGRILIMDDADYLLMALEEQLNPFGFEVLVASDGKDAVNIVDEALKAGRPIRLAILDLTIPGGLGGKETVALLHALDAGLPCIASSGYSDDPVMAAPGAFGFAGGLGKPYSKDELAKVLSELGMLS